MVQSVRILEPAILREYFVLFLVRLKDHELASTWADVSGFFIAIVGFAATLWNVVRSKNAAIKAQEAAQAARDSIRQFDSIVDFSTAIAVLEEIKRSHRETGVSNALPERYAAIRKQLIVLRASSVDLSDEHLAVIQDAIANLRTMETYIEKALANKTEFPVARFNSLLSRDIDKLVDVLTSEDKSGDAAMSLEKPRKLMDVLVKRTEAGLVDWMETLPDIFQVSFKDNSVQIRMVVDRENETVTYVVSLLNGEGETVDKFSDEDLDNDQFGNTGGPWYAKLASMFGMARRRARGADKVLDEILKEIDDDIPF